MMRTTRMQIPVLMMMVSFLVSFLLMELADCVEDAVEGDSGVIAGGGDDDDDDDEEK